MSDLREREPDDSPVMFVHPDDIDLPEIKANFAKMGITVRPSNRVQRGQVYFHDPKATAW